MHRPMAFRHFYPGDCRRQITDMLSRRNAPQEMSGLHAVVVPHAGWRFSGGVAARTLRTLAVSRPMSLICFSAVHRAWLEKPALYPLGSWETPLGDVPVDEELAAEIVSRAGDLVDENPAAHTGEHALEVLMPFLHELFPGVPVVPIMVAPDARPVELGERLAHVIRGREIAAIASTDFTHYGASFAFLPSGTGPAAHDWMRANDRRLIDRALRLDAESIVDEAREHHNACGPGALAAAVAFARASGSTEGTLLEHTDSHDVDSPDSPFEMAVGYAGIAL